MFQSTPEIIPSGAQKALRLEIFSPKAQVDSLTFFTNLKLKLNWNVLKHLSYTLFIILIMVVHQIPTPPKEKKKYTLPHPK